MKTMWVNNVKSDNHWGRKPILFINGKGHILRVDANETLQKDLSEDCSLTVLKTSHGKKEQLSPCSGEYDVRRKILWVRHKGE